MQYGIGMGKAPNGSRESRNHLLADTLMRAERLVAHGQTRLERTKECVQLSLFAIRISRQSLLLAKSRPAQE